MVHILNNFKKHMCPFILSTIFIFAIDQISKRFAVHAVSYTKSITIIRDFLHVSVGKIIL